ncbi:MAG TPA: nuclear transport factor 2 family protein, partial [Dehalococcoidia bacterium]|nr:nuclear transport factor 2 family protein [Dehalococcoidia bacterium]
MATDMRSELLSLEKRFWDAMQRKDADTAARMSGDSCVIVGAQGVSAIDKQTMAKLTVEGDWSIESYEFDDASVQVQSLCDHTALIAYKVTERLRV